MPRKKTRHLTYAMLLVFSSIVVYSALANRGSFRFMDAFGWSFATPAPVVENDVAAEESNAAQFVTNEAMQPMFTTIIQGADEEVGCSDNGITIARYSH